jgi:hypothetical protein
MSSGEAVQLRGAHVGHHHRGQSHGRLRPWRIVALFGALLWILIGIGALAGSATAPHTTPACSSSRPCGTPPRLGQALVNQTVWRSSAFGFTLEYPGNLLNVAKQGTAGIVLGAQLHNGDQATIIVHGQSGSGGLSAAINSQLGQLQGISQVAADTNSADAVLGPSVGYIGGTGGLYEGVSASPQGVQQTDEVAAESASNGRVVVTVLVIAPAGDSGAQSDLYKLADTIFNSVTWPGGS